MARIHLDVDDLANRLTLRAILAAAGHRVTDETPDIVITDQRNRAVEIAKTTPTLLLATASTVSEAVAAMREGVYGYLFVPFQPGEAELMIKRVMASASAGNGRETGAGFTPMTLDEIDARHIMQTLRYCKNNQARAARLLGIGRNTLWRKLKNLKPKNRFD